MTQSYASVTATAGNTLPSPSGVQERAPRSAAQPKHTRSKLSRITLTQSQQDQTNWPAAQFPKLLVELPASVPGRFGILKSHVELVLATQNSPRKKRKKPILGYQRTQLTMGVVASSLAATHKLIENPLTMNGKVLPWSTPKGPIVAVVFKDLPVEIYPQRIIAAVHKFSTLTHLEQIGNNDDDWAGNWKGLLQLAPNGSPQPHIEETFKVLCSTDCHLRKECGFLETPSESCECTLQSLPLQPLPPSPPTEVPISPDAGNIDQYLVSGHACSHGSSSKPSLNDSSTAQAKTHVSGQESHTGSHYDTIASSEPLSSQQHYHPPPLPTTTTSRSSRPSSSSVRRQSVSECSPVAKPKAHSSSTLSRPAMSHPELERLLANQHTSLHGCTSSKTSSGRILCSDLEATPLEDVPNGQRY
ncbi:hypothetical protein H4219_006406 [Mycoemilia scoparia]|uniref:Uncharacterized protein n=1 Tax=Mycoemilia scoparia TaxID=417184 RepID=A0A9W7ZHR8_9FUNG|nr:hypothetical protein H4219_006406 [Mycoemilia scoparia]